MPRSAVPHAELQQAIREADVLVAHAGTGIALTAFNAGVFPVLIPREHLHQEHVDNHQSQTADLLSGAGLATTTDVDSLDMEHLLAASAQRIERDGEANTLDLLGART